MALTASLIHPRSPLALTGANASSPSSPAPRSSSLLTSLWPPWAVCCGSLREKSAFFPEDLKCRERAQVERVPLAASGGGGTTRCCCVTALSRCSEEIIRMRKLKILPCTFFFYSSNPISQVIWSPGRVVSCQNRLRMN